jgi:hypothetical protein
MLNRTFAILLATLLSVASFGLQTSSAQAAGYTAEQARAGVAKAGVGQKARVEVRLRDNTKLKGYVSEAGADSFTLNDAKTGAARSIAYADVAQVRRQGGGLSTGTKAIIWGGVAAGAAITLYAVRGAFCDGQC